MIINGKLCIRVSVPIPDVKLGKVAMELMELMELVEKAEKGVQREKGVPGDKECKEKEQLDALGDDSCSVLEYE